MNRREFLKSALVTGVAVAFGKVSFETVEDEADQRIDQLLALAGDSTVVINARIQGGDLIIDADKAQGALVAQSVFEEVETEPGCIIQWLSKSRAIMVTDRGDVFSTIDGGAIWHECTVHVDLPGDADADPWERLMDWNSQYDTCDLCSMVARAEVIHEST